MSRTAVSPIASPIRARRSSALGMAAWTGDEGCSRRTAKKQAEKRNAPSPNASLAASREWRRSASRTVIAVPSWSFSALLEELGDEAGPSGLVAGADTGPVVAVEVLMKRQVIPEVRIPLQLLLAPEDRSAPALVAQE